MTIIFRVDASYRIGTGHVMRCLTLADALQGRGVESHFICRAHAGNLIEMIRLRAHRVHVLPSILTLYDEDLTPPHTFWLGCSWEQDAEETNRLIKEIHPDWLIVDHYALDARWEKKVERAGMRVLVIDDLTDRPHDCDLFLNQNLGARAEEYRGLIPGKTRLMMGPRFALLRAKFRAHREEKPTSNLVLNNHWLACVGGTDPHQILPKILAAWRALSEPKPTLGLAVRANCPNLPALIEGVAGQPGVSLYTNNEDMAELLMNADLLIGSTGSISWERCCLGVPSIMGMVAENQRRILEVLTQARTGISIGEWQSITIDELTVLLRKLGQRPQLLQRMGQRARKLVDGKGVERVIISVSIDLLNLRPADMKDSDYALAWRNDLQTRLNSLDKKLITANEHNDWWRQSINAPSRCLLVAQVAATPVGVLRLDRNGSKGIISIYIDPNLTGLGLGTALLSKGIMWFRKNLPEIENLLATIRSENTVSIRSFEKVGFKEIDFSALTSTYQLIL